MFFWQNREKHENFEGFKFVSTVTLPKIISSDGIVFSDGTPPQ